MCSTPVEMSLLDLPAELQLAVLQRLDAHSVTRFSLTCRSAHHFVLTEGRRLPCRSINTLSLSRHRVRGYASSCPAAPLFDVSYDASVFRRVNINMLVIHDFVLDDAACEKIMRLFEEESNKVDTVRLSNVEMAASLAVLDRLIFCVLRPQRVSTRFVRVRGEQCIDRLAEQPAPAPRRCGVMAASTSSMGSLLQVSHAVFEEM